MEPRLHSLKRPLAAALLISNDLPSPPWGAAFLTRRLSVRWFVFLYLSLWDEFPVRADSMKWQREQASKSWFVTGKGESCGNLWCGWANVPPLRVCMTWWRGMRADGDIRPYVLSWSGKHRNVGAGVPTGPLLSPLPCSPPPYIAKINPDHSGKEAAGSDLMEPSANGPLRLHTTIAPLLPHIGTRKGFPLRR